MNHIQRFILTKDIVERSCSKCIRSCSYKLDHRTIWKESISYDEIVKNQLECVREGGERYEV